MIEIGGAVARRAAPARCAAHRDARAICQCCVCVCVCDWGKGGNGLDVEGPINRFDSIRLDA
jgi:hypothetical protein